MKTNTNASVRAELQSVRATVLGHIKILMRNGKLRPGNRLPSERDMAAELKVDRGTIREVVGYLSILGVLERRVGRGGTIVASSGSAILIEPLSLLTLLDRPTPENVFEARELLEVQLAASAAERRTEADLHRIEEACRRIVETPPEASGIPQNVANQAFHEALAAAAHNPILEGIYHAVMYQRRNSIDSAAPTGSIDRTRWVICNEIHEMIVDAIRRQNAADARRAMTMDMAMASEAWRWVQKEVNASKNTVHPEPDEDGRDIAMAQGGTDHAVDAESENIAV